MVCSNFGWGQIWPNGGCRARQQLMSGVVRYQPSNDVVVDDFGPEISSRDIKLKEMINFQHQRNPDIRFNHHHEKSTARECNMSSTASPLFDKIRSSNAPKRPRHQPSQQNLRCQSPLPRCGCTRKSQFLNLVDFLRHSDETSSAPSSTLFQSEQVPNRRLSRRMLPFDVEARYESGAVQTTMHMRLRGFRRTS